MSADLWSKIACNDISRVCCFAVDVNLAVTVCESVVVDVGFDNVALAVQRTVATYVMIVRV